MKLAFNNGMLAILVFALLSPGWVTAQEKGRRSRRPEHDSAPKYDSPGIDKGIVWYGVLKDGLAEAERTNKPILLMSAAPQCIGVSGMW